MLKQYEAMTAQKIEERKDVKDRRPSLRTLLLKESFEALSKPLVFSLGAACNENNKQLSFDDKQFDNSVSGPILKMISSNK